MLEKSSLPLFTKKRDKNPTQLPFIPYIHQSSHYFKSSKIQSIST